MSRTTIHFVVLAIFALAQWGFSAVAPDAVMGNWEGKWSDDVSGGGGASAQIIAEGGGNYRAVVSADIGEAEPIRGEIRGKLEGEKVVFKGEIDAGPEGGGVFQITGDVSDGKFVGRYVGQENRGGFTLKKVHKVSPILGANPPEGAIVLFDGKDSSKWVDRNGQPNPWEVADGAMKARNGDIHTKQQFRDFKLHVEFCTPFEPEERGQARGNSGVYLPVGNEIQVLDSFGLKPSRYDCGAFYGQAGPLVNACLPPGEWQTYDVTFIAPRFDKNDNLIKSASITVFHNGVKIHEEFHPKRRAVAEGSILLQDHGDKVQYRNIWLVPLKAD